MRSHWMTYKGKKIIICNYSNFEMDHEAIAKDIEAVDEMICSQPEKSVLALLDIRGTVGTPEIISHFRQSAMKTKKHVLKNAVVGLTGIQRLLATGISRFSGQDFKSFDNEEEAKNWLVE